MECEVCGAKLTGLRTRFCSRKCTNRYYMKLRLEKNRASKGNCQICGSKLPAHCRKFCSRECRKAHYSELHKQQLKMRERRHCVICGVEFEGNATEIYCSEECRERALTVGRERHCPVCGEKFVTRVKNQKYCSEECKSKAYRREKVKCKCRECGAEFMGGKHRRFCSKKCSNRYFDREYNLKKYGKLTERECKWCGSKFKPRSRKHIFCRLKCAQRSHQAQIEARTKTSKCVICGTEFKVKARSFSKYCSAECRLKGRRKNLRRLRVCPVCGREFLGTSARSKYCSKECRFEQLQHKYNRNVGNGVCEQCGRLYHKKAASQRYCSHECRRQALWEALPERHCKYCGKAFKSTNGAQIYCNVECRKNHALSERSKPRVKRAYEKKVKVKVKPLKNLSEYVREARECNLDYGTYKAYLAMGKTYEELKAQVKTE